MDRAYTPDRKPIEQLLAASEQYLRFALDHPQFFRMLAFPTNPSPYPAAAESAALLALRSMSRTPEWSTRSNAALPMAASVTWTHSQRRPFRGQAGTESSASRGDTTIFGRVLRNWREQLIWSATVHG